MPYVNEYEQRFKRAQALKAEQDVDPLMQGFAKGAEEEDPEYKRKARQEAIKSTVENVGALAKAAGRNVSEELARPLVQEQISLLQQSQPQMGGLQGFTAQQEPDIAPVSGMDAKVRAGMIKPSQPPIFGDKTGLGGLKPAQQTSILNSRARQIVNTGKYQDETTGEIIVATPEEYAFAQDALLKLQPGLQPEVITNKATAQALATKQVESGAKARETIAALDAADSIINKIEADANSVSDLIGPVGGRIQAGKAVFSMADPRFVSFVTQTRANLSAVINQISGTAASDKERVFINSFQPSEKDSHSTLLAKTESLKAINRVKKLAALNGASMDIGTIIDPGLSPEEKLKQISTIERTLKASSNQQPQGQPGQIKIMKDKTTGENVKVRQNPDGSFTEVL